MKNKTNLMVFLAGVLLFSTLACNVATSLTPGESSHSLTPAASPSITATTDDRGTSCGSLLNDIVSVATTSGSDTEPQEEKYLVTYDVAGDKLLAPQFAHVPEDLMNIQQDLATQQKTWEYFTALIPESERAMVSKYAILTDGQANLLSAVRQTPDDPKQWTLEVDIADSADYYNLTFTLIHEFGHLLTLNADQVPPSQGIFSRRDHSKVHDLAVSLCPSYYPGEGCSRTNSYINQFYQRFWTNIYEKWKEIDRIEDDRAYYEKLNRFYEQHQDQFLTGYAATDPAEDIAESWAYFVLAPTPDGDTISEEKVLFFYEYPELVKLRQEVLGRLCTSFPDPHDTE